MIMLKIYCERSWIILENIEIIFFEKNSIEMCLGSGAFCKYNDTCFTHVILILHSKYCNVYRVVCCVSRPDVLAKDDCIFSGCIGQEVFILIVGEIC